MFELTYPRNTDLNGVNYLDCVIENGITGSTHIAFSNVSTLSPMVWTINGNDVSNIEIIPDAGLNHVLIPNTGLGQQTLIFTDESAIMDVQNITPVNGTGSFTDFSATNF